ncbi:exodeoxyribonuclease VII small subunit [Pirellulales bacterium]|nr:exodeoxyribonuclease VII small subunit [Pirellulales bacterium]
MTDKKPKVNKKQPSFEASLDQLDAVINQMESRELGLTESIEAYEQGVSLLRQLHNELSDIEQRVVTLVRIDEDGNPVFENVDNSNENGPKKSKASRRRSTKSQGLKAEATQEEHNTTAVHHKTRHQLPGMDDPTPRT